MSVDDSIDQIDQIDQIVRRAASAQTPVEAILATSFGCPYEGRVEPAAATALAGRLAEVGVSTFSFADTTGMATPPAIDGLLDALIAVALHLEGVIGRQLPGQVMRAGPWYRLPAGT